MRLFNGELHIHQAADIKRAGHGFGLAGQLGHGFGLQGPGRQGTGRIARMDARLFDMLHDSRDIDLFAVKDGVHVHLGGARQILVDQHGRGARHLHGVADIAGQLLVVADDFHSPAAQHIGGPDDHGIADLMSGGEGLFGRAGYGVDRLHQPDFVEQLLEALAVLGKVDGVGRGAEDGNASIFQRLGELQRGLSAELDDDAQQGSIGLFGLEQLQHVFGGQGLEIEAIRSVVIGRDGLGIAVDHDRFDADLRQGEGGVAAAIVKLDALADPVRSPAQNHGLFGRSGLAFALRILAQKAGFIGRIHVGRLGEELGRAGVDALIDRAHAKRPAAGAKRVLVLAGQGAETGVGETHGLQRAQGRRIGGQAVLPDLGFGLDNLGDLAQEPGLVGTGGVDLFDAQSMAKGLGDDAQPIRRGLIEGAHHGGLDLARVLGVGARKGDLVKAAKARLQAAQGLLAAFLEGAANGHHLAH